VIYGPTFAEMRDPSLLPGSLREQARAARERPLDPLNLFNISWKADSWKADGAVPYTVLPEAFTGVPAPIVVLCARGFPTGSHKVGPAYSVLVEKQIEGICQPERDTLVFPSTGNFGIGGAWVGPRMGYRSLVVLPEEMSAERFEKIRGFGADVIATPGSESNVKEIYDKVRELRAHPENRILNQFEEFGNYRFHFSCTASAALEAAAAARLEVAAFVSAMGSAGTIAAGEGIKRTFGKSVTVAVEPIQCPTLYNAGFGAHRVEGIGDKHVTWVHNVWATDLLVCVDDQECLESLQLVQEGTDVLASEGIDPTLARSWVDLFGISSLCNILAAIRAARHYKFGARQAVVTVATDGFDRYPSVLRRLDAQQGPMTRDSARQRLERLRRGSITWLQEGTPENRRRWHNQKYFTWVEQQGRTVAELRAQEDPAYWAAQQERIPDLDRRILERRS
jgi:cysteine synthase